MILTHRLTRASRPPASHPTTDPAPKPARRFERGSMSIAALVLSLSALAAAGRGIARSAAKFAHRVFALSAEIRERLIELAPIFTKQKHMLGDEFSMLDVAIAPLLWRLDHYGIDLGKQAAPLMKYAERIFSRQGFIDALTPPEKVMRR